MNRDEVDSLIELLAGDPADELAALLAELRWLVLKHPLAARSAVRALVAEGRRFAATDEGERWRRRLAGSELVRRGQVVWEAGTMNALDGEAGTLPTELIDAFCYATTRGDLEPALSRALEPIDREDDA
ncbi:MAG: hypothetical protein ACM31C_27185 [Acidobacteriota bacterium]